MTEQASVTFILGGARSGKSKHAETVVQAYPPPWRYIATAEAQDEEMTKRIEAHRARRGAKWTTIEAPIDLTGILGDIPAGTPVLVDCLTLWLTNVMLAGRDVERECERLTKVLAQPSGPWVVVSNEVGLGIVPDNALARRFRDAAGRLNRLVATNADEVLFMVAGLPMKVK
ncbi:MAG: bifunctional adenosylcobinamide kinase/adenosylcobinamide-phosphate guanylyltransferase [Pseudomonadota bacterium]